MLGYVAALVSSLLSWPLLSLVPSLLKLFLSSIKFHSWLFVSTFLEFKFFTIFSFNIFVLLTFCVVSDRRSWPSLSRVCPDLGLQITGLWVLVAQLNWIWQPDVKVNTAGTEHSLQDKLRMVYSGVRHQQWEKTACRARIFSLLTLWNEDLLWPKQRWLWKDKPRLFSWVLFSLCKVRIKCVLQVG